jgi:hypothetical protein
VKQPADRKSADAEVPPKNQILGAAAGGSKEDAADATQLLKSAAQAVLKEENSHSAKETSQELQNAFAEVTKEQQVAETLMQIAAAELAGGSIDKEARSPIESSFCPDGQERKAHKSFSKLKQAKAQYQTAAWSKLYSESTAGSSFTSGKTRSSSVSSTSSKRPNIKESRERLSRPSSSSDGRKYVKEDDVKNCTFQPKINKSSRNMIRGSGSFMKRFESSHESKSLAINHKRAKAEYDARINKKQCPKCHTEQSYDEFVNHKTTCRDCKVKFRHPVCWQEVGDQFLDRMESKQEERESKLADIESKTAPPFSLPVKAVYDPEYGVVRTVKPARQTWAHVSDSFLQRMENDACKRKANSELARQQSLCDPECTFAPRLETANYSSELGFSDAAFFDRMERDAMRRHRDTSRNEIRAQFSYTFPERCFKKPSAWDEPTFTGGQRRNPSKKWV